MTAAVLLGTGDMEWNTPAQYIESARLVMGAIDLDPASNGFAQETVKAKVFYTLENDGLIKNWQGKVWLNPPFTAKIINKFISKLVGSFVAGLVTEAIAVTNNAGDTGWWHEAANGASAICITRGRIKFLKQSGKYNSPICGQCFFYLGRNPDKFKTEFSRYGFVVEL